MRNLKQLAEWRILMTAPKAMAKEKILHKMWSENERTKLKITELQEQLATMKAKLNTNLQQKNEQVETFQRNINQLEQDNYDVIKKEMYVGLY